MLKYLLIVVVFVFTAYVPATSAQSSYDVVLLRIDALILEMQKLKQEVLALKQGASTPVSSVLGAGASKILTQSLQYGETNGDIARIQKLLSTDPEIYSYGIASGFFGPKTEEAIRNFQIHFNLEPVGVIGPATTALLEGYMRMYPARNYPADIFDAKPQVLGASTSVTPTLATPSVPVTPGVNPAKSIDVNFDDGESLITINYRNGTRKGLIADSEDEDEVIDYIESQTSLTALQIEDVIDFSKKSKSKSSSNDSDEDDADDALDDADDAIDDAREEINRADDDGDDVDWADETLDDADDAYDDAEDAYDNGDWDDAVDLAEEAEDLARKAENRIDEEKGSEQGDSDDIDSIEVEVDEDESEVTVEYGNGDEYVFTVEEDQEDDIIEEVADELDMDEDDVEDLIEFDFGNIDYINVRIDENSSIAFVVYNSGVERRIRMDETDEDEIIEEIADAIDEDEDDVEEDIDFDYD